LGKVKNLIHNKFEAQIDTGKMMQTLLQKVQQSGVQILFGLKIQKIIDQENSVILQTSDFDFLAKKILICTNGFAQQLLPNIDVKPARSQVLITKPIRDLKIKGTFHYNKGFYYFRNVGNRILFGGGRNLAFEEETTDEIALTDLIQNQLNKILKEIILPKTDFEIDMRWSGIMGVGNEKLPITKWLNESTAVALRCNGMGVALGSQIGMDGANLILESGI
jgi:glycine/D-amino acid oxidase-like deaminating enzyme